MFNLNKRLVRDFKVAMTATVKYTSPYANGTNPNYSPTYGYRPNYVNTPSTPHTANSFRKLERKNHECLVRINSGHDDFRECGMPPIADVEAITLFFYEMSSTTKGCRYYDSLSEFYKFMVDYKLNLSDANKTRLKTGAPFWGVCKPEKHDILIFPSRREMVSFLMANHAE